MDTRSNDRRSGAADAQAAAAPSLVNIKQSLGEMKIVISIAEKADGFVHAQIVIEGVVKHEFQVRRYTTQVEALESSAMLLKMDAALIVANFAGQ